MDNLRKETYATSESTEIYTKKVLVGNIENVRNRIAAALETLDYIVISDNPNIIGRRGAKGWGSWFASADIFDYPMTLTIHLKPIDEHSTQATFDYSVKHAGASKSQKNIVLQEAKTIVAISKKQSIEKMCSVCRTESTDDSRFCRKCGTPLTSEKTDLEVLRIMKESLAAKTSVITSSLLTPISMIVLIAAFLLNNAGLIKPKLFPVLLIVGGLGFLIGMISSFFGWNRLKRALDISDEETRQTYRDIPKSLETGEFEELPPNAPRASITEGTTNLLDKEWTNQREREKVPISRKRETNNLD